MPPEAKVTFARVGPHVSQELGKIGSRKGRMRHQQHRRGGEDGDRRQVLERIVR